MDYQTAKIVCKDPSTTSEQLHEYAHSEDRWVRSEVAKHGANTAEDTLLLLSKDEDPVVRGALIERQDVPDQVLINIARTAQGTNEIHKILMRKHLGVVVQKYILDSPYEDVLSSLAKRSDACEDVLIKLSDSDSYMVGMEVVRNKNTPADILLRLGRKYPDSIILNPSAPSCLIVEALEPVETRRYRSYIAASNPACPDLLLKKMANVEEWYKDCHVRTYEKEEFLGKLASEARLTNDVFIALCKAASGIRSQMTKNKTVTPAQLIQLIRKDKSKVVVNAAITFLRSSGEVEKKVLNGQVSLSDVVYSDKSGTMRFGDYLISVGMVDRFQELQSFELEGLLKRGGISSPAETMSNTRMSKLTL